MLHLPEGWLRLVQVVASRLRAQGLPAFAAKSHSQARSLYGAPQEPGYREGCQVAQSVERQVMSSPSMSSGPQSIRQLPGHTTAPLLG